MPDLMLHDRPVKTMFDLLGHQENDLTKALGWVLTQSRRLRNEILQPVFGQISDENIRIRLQEFGSEDGGYTDIEMTGTRVALILEAKLSWSLPSEAQLRRYCARLEPFEYAALVSVSQWSADYARHRLPPHVPSASGRLVNVSHLSWSDISSCASRAKKQGSSHGERQLLADLTDYLRGVMNMQNQHSNYVFVVRLSSTPITSDSRSKIDLKDERGIFWYPMSANKLKKPPNYIAFCYDDMLQSVHHVDEHEVAHRLADARLLSGLSVTERDKSPYLVFKLGNAMKPGHQVKNGGARSGSWCMLDALLTSNTVAEARAETKRREAISL